MTPPPQIAERPTWISVPPQAAIRCRLARSAILQRIQLTRAQSQPRGYAANTAGNGQLHHRSSGPGHRPSRSTSAPTARPTASPNIAGTTYNLRGLTQNGVPPGAFSSVTTQTNGDIVVNYDNGQSRTIAQVPVVTFNAPDTLQRQNGQAFTASTSSGTPLAECAGTNGAGNLVTQSVESSNVDIATEFSKLIVAQQAYSANAKLVTTADQMLQQTIDMKQ